MNQPHSKHHVYFRLEAHHSVKSGEPRLQIFISRAQAREIMRGAKLPAKGSRGHKKFHVAVFVEGRAYTKLAVETFHSHKRRCAARGEMAPWVLR